MTSAETREWAFARTAGYDQPPPPLAECDVVNTMPKQTKAAPAVWVHLDNGWKAYHSAALGLKSLFGEDVVRRAEREQPYLVHRLEEHLARVH